MTGTPATGGQAKILATNRTIDRNAVGPYAAGSEAPQLQGQVLGQIVSGDDATGYTVVFVNADKSTGALAGERIRKAVAGGDDLEAGDFCVLWYQHGPQAPPSILTTSGGTGGGSGGQLQDGSGLHYLST